MALFDAEDRVRVLGAQAIEQFKGCWRLAAVVHSHERVHVPPGRLNAPGTTLPAQEFRAQQAVRLLALEELSETIKQIVFA
ncbi:MAG: hypothetical protein ACRDTF_01805, partial [Pseudonocardiaceae bacterium]